MCEAPCLTGAMLCLPTAGIETPLFNFTMGTGDIGRGAAKI